MVRGWLTRRGLANKAAVLCPEASVAPVALGKHRLRKQRQAKQKEEDKLLEDAMSLAGRERQQLQE
eukprot:12027487-Prorocentrum_lima.AAC.1